MMDSLNAQRLAVRFGIDADDAVAEAVLFALAEPDQFGRWLDHQRYTQQEPPRPLRRICTTCGESSAR